MGRVVWARLLHIVLSRSLRLDLPLFAGYTWAIYSKAHKLLAVVCLPSRQALPLR